MAGMAMPPATGGSPMPAPKLSPITTVANKTIAGGKKRAAGLGGRRGLARGPKIGGSFGGKR